MRWTRPTAAAGAGWGTPRWPISTVRICACSPAPSISKRSAGPNWRTSRVVLDAARLGDPEAAALVERAANALAALAANAIARLGLSGVSVPVAFTGGLFANAEFTRRTVEALNVLAPSARAVKPLRDPATGAARLALEGA